MGLIKKYFRAIIVMLAAVIAVIIYDLAVPRQYEVASRVVIHRSPIESPGYSTEESKNRWIWVRDGYAIKDSLLSQSFLNQLLAQTPQLAERYQQYVRDNSGAIQASTKLGLADSDVKTQFLAEFARNISVDYLGGDSFTYVLLVKDHSPALAKAVSEGLIAKLKNVVVEQTRQSYVDSLAALRAELKQNNTPEAQPYLSDTYRGILAASIIFNSGAERRIEVVQAPSIPLEPVWPKLDRLLILAAVAGLALGLLLEYLVTSSRRHELRVA